MVERINHHYFKGKEMNSKVKVAKQLDFDIEGLKTDFPTAKDLERFVYDQTKVVLNLKGRSNDVKYQVAMNVLNGESVDEKYLGAENPYIDRADLIPEEPLKPVPDRASGLPPVTQIANTFYSPMIPHPDPESRSRKQQVQVQFRKYRNGVITYEVLGPIEPRPEGKVLDKYGKERPEIIRWIDPRTGEQVLRDKEGIFTEIGNRLRAVLLKQGVWTNWVDKDITRSDNTLTRDVWGTDV
jgi:hypothetical protein